MEGLEQEVMLSKTHVFQDFFLTRSYLGLLLPLSILVTHGAFVQ